MRSRIIRRNKISVFWILVLLLTSLNGHAQDLQLSGQVVDAEDNRPIPNVTVTVKGTSKSSATDVNGNFTIVARVGNVLTFSNVAYRREEKNLIGPGSIHVAMRAKKNTLEEVVVVGYGTQKRKDLTGSIASVTSKDLAIAQATTFDQALQGRVAGVMVQTASGQPGGAASVTIRGLGTLLANKDPLYVIDGVIIPPNYNSSTGGVYLGNNQINTNPLSTINPSEIASIDVLKDASAIAIYGSQGSAGVVVITTKRGQAGTPRINFDGYYGVQKVYKRIPMLNLREYADFINIRTAIQGGAPRPEFVNPKYLGDGSNWQEELFRSAATYNANLSLSGGDVRTQYLLSGSYFNQEGLVVGSDFKRQSFKLNLDNKTTNWLKLGNSLTISNIRENVNSSQYNVVGMALGLTPDIAVESPDGSITFPPGFVGDYNPNPIAAAALNTNNLGRTQIFGNMYADLKLFDGLNLRNEYSLNVDYGNVARAPGSDFQLSKNSFSFLNGDILLESDEGIGTIFTISIPFSKEVEESIDEISVLGDQLEPANATNLPVRDKSGLSPKKKTLLIVEDDGDMRFILKDNLKNDFNILEACDGKEGWQKTLFYHPDIILSDVSMPVVNGVEFCKKIKEDTRTYYIPVILLTALTSEEEQIRGLHIGANDYITKPFSFEVVRSKINNLIVQQDSFKKVYQKRVKVTPTDVHVESPNDKFLKELLQNLENNISDSNLTVDGLARMLFMGRVTLYNRIISITGKTPLEFIKSYRLKRAAQLLETGNLTISQVCYRAGFKTQKHFVKLFKEEFGVIPSKYRDNLDKQGS